MISVVKASAQSLNNITVNLPYHRVIAITGKHPEFGPQFVNEVLFRESALRIAACGGEPLFEYSIAQSKAGAQFLSGLYTPIHLNAPIAKNQTLLHFIAWPGSTKSAFPINPKLSVSGHLTLLSTVLKAQTEPNMEQGYWVNLLQNLESLGFGTHTMETGLDTFEVFQIPLLALAKADALKMQGLMYFADFTLLPDAYPHTNRLVELMQSVRTQGNTVFVNTQNLNILQHSDWVMEFESTMNGSANLLHCGSAKKYFELYSPFLQSLIPDSGTKLEHITPTVKGAIGESPIELKGVSTHNLKHVSVNIPYKKLTVITGVSGSGKSSLAMDTVLALSNRLWQSLWPTQHQTISFMEAQVTQATGLMPSVGVFPYTLPAHRNKTVSEATLMHPLLEKFFNQLAQNPVPFEIEGIHIQHFVNQTVTEALHLTRSWATLPQRISPDMAVTKTALLTLAGIINKLDILSLLGLGYISLSRPLNSLSGGEQQRVRLATAISAELSGLCVVLDEPTRGLHPTDINNLLLVLRELNRQGNTIVVCEHHPKFISFADYVIDLGPGSGPDGGQVVAQGTVAEILNHPLSVTGQYLLRHRNMGHIKRDGNPTKCLMVKGAKANHLKHLDLSIPSECLTVIHGVSGSGKSSLLELVVYHSFVAEKAVECESISGFQHFSTVRMLEQQCRYEQTEISISQFWESAATALKSELAKLLGIEHLSLERRLGTLSGGEFQRLNLLMTLHHESGSRILFLLDEPTAGLHLKDVENLLKAFQLVLEAGHTIIISEHNEALINAADYVLELGPGAGLKGGDLVYAGVNSPSYQKFLANRVLIS